MTPEEAIKILKYMGTPDYRGSTEGILKARNLGIEALKRLQELRLYEGINPNALLPGETEE